MEYTPEGGKVKIAVAKKDDWFLFTVRDTGIGIPEEEQKKIFDKFYRGTNARYVKTDGTGLRFYIAYEAVKLLDGEIRFESTLNSGTAFFVELPIEAKPKEDGKAMT